jgi:hypothetical protein
MRPKRLLRIKMRWLPAKRLSLGIFGGNSLGWTSVVYVNDDLTLAERPFSVKQNLPQQRKLRSISRSRLVGGTGYSFEKQV